MFTEIITRIAATTLVGGLLVLGAAARAAVLETDHFQLSADFRLRIESDWASRTADGIARDDRHRARARVRVGLKFEPVDHFELGVRVRSGTDSAQQGAHITFLDFSGNDTGPADFNIDKWYLKGKWKGLSGWIGRNGFPFFQQNELLWDNDAMPAGIAVAYTAAATGTSRFTVNAGYLSLPVGMQKFAGELAAGQLLFESTLDSVAIKAAAGLFAFDSDPNDPDIVFLLEGNGARDYTILAGNLQAVFQLGGRPLRLGVDIFANLEDYAGDPDPFTAANANETEGFVVSAQYGGLKHAGDWLAGYYYARIEQFAVNNSYAQDDWLRFGGGGQTRGSNFKGHEFRFGYAFTQNINLLARLYIVQAITTIEEGNRLRFDFNWKF